MARPGHPSGARAGVSVAHLRRDVHLPLVPWRKKPRAHEKKRWPGLLAEIDKQPVTFFQHMADFHPQLGLCQTLFPNRLSQKLVASMALLRDKIKQKIDALLASDELHWFIRFS